MKENEQEVYDKSMREALLGVARFVPVAVIGGMEQSRNATEGLARHPA